MKDYSLGEIIQMATRKEEESVRFYRKASELVHLSGTRQLFLELADEETKHRDMLENLDLAELEQAQPERVPDLHISDYLVEPPFTDQMHYDEILRVAMKREEKSVHLYEHLLTKTQVEKALKLLQFLLEQEHRHKYRLEREYDDNVLANM